MNTASILVVLQLMVSLLISAQNGTQEQKLQAIETSKNVVSLVLREIENEPKPIIGVPAIPVTPVIPTPIKEEPKPDVCTLSGIVKDYGDGIHKYINFTWTLNGVENQDAGKLYTPIGQSEGNVLWGDSPVPLDKNLQVGVVEHYRANIGKAWCYANLPFDPPIGTATR